MPATARSLRIASSLAGFEVTTEVALPWRVSEGDRDSDEGLGSNGELLRFPKEHWIHLQTTNIVESPFDMIRLRTNAARRFKGVDNASTMIWKPLRIGEKA
jgi:transposase-like protein